MKITSGQFETVYKKTIVYHYYSHFRHFIYKTYEYLYLYFLVYSNVYKYESSFVNRFARQ